MATAQIIEDELLKHLAGIRAHQNPTLYYDEFAALPAINDRRNLSWSKPQLDSIRKKYGSDCDITIVLKNRRTHYPSQINGKKAADLNSLTSQDKSAAHKLLQGVINRLCPGALNPY